MLADFSDVHFWAINTKEAQTIIKKMKMFLQKECQI